MANEAMKKLAQRAAQIDQRRQGQIERQKKIIDRLLKENEAMLNFIGELASQEGNLLGFRDGAKATLAKIDQIRGEANGK